MMILLDKDTIRIRFTGIIPTKNEKTATDERSSVAARFARVGPSPPGGNGGTLADTGCKRPQIPRNQ
ncbi:MAG: hypothetical protein JW809_07685 [Pirellulales bacterium]|nr:hypothetical protein [Pirellulales bacterium]